MHVNMITRFSANPPASAAGRTSATENGFKTEMPDANSLAARLPFQGAPAGYSSSLGSQTISLLLQIQAESSEEASPERETDDKTEEDTDLLNKKKSGKNRQAP